MKQIEDHSTHRVGWLRGAVLGANDGIVSTASLVLGVAAAGASSRSILVAGVAGLVAGAMSMASSEYVSASSQADAERADLEKEKRELETQPEQEFQEMVAIYAARGLDESLASQVVTQLMARDAIGTHARDELGISESFSARPIRTGLASAATFALGGLFPLLVALSVPFTSLPWAVAGSSLVFLGVLGSAAAHAGGASRLNGAVRVMMWGALAMMLTAAAGMLFGALV